MIPKVIHYCWFGGAPLPELAKKCIASWKKHCPDYEIKQWNETNFDVNFCDFAKGDDRILFTGFVQGQVLQELYSNPYLYTLPSDLEGMPLSLLEAMSYGNCCLVSDIAECAEVIEDKALIFKKADVADLTQKLQFACDHPETVAAYKAGAADFICGKYNWDDVVERTLKLYQDGAK